MEYEKKYENFSIYRGKNRNIFLLVTIWLYYVWTVLEYEIARSSGVSEGAKLANIHSSSTSALAEGDYYECIFPALTFYFTK